MSADWMDRLWLGAMSTLSLLVLGCVGWAFMTFTPAFVEFGRVFGKLLAAVVAAFVLAYAQGYFWTDVAPEIASRLRAWHDHFAGSGGEKA